MKLGAKLAILACFGMLTMGCGLQKQLAKAMGVKTKTERVETKDLGGSYNSLTGTQWDFFAAPTPKGAKGKKGAKGAKGAKGGEKLPDQRVNVSFKTFDMKGIDDFNRSANRLYAQFLFADRVVQKTKKDLAGMLDIKSHGKSINELAKVSKGKKVTDVSSVQRGKDLVKTVEMAARGMVGIVDKAMELKNAGTKLVGSAPGDLMKDPRKAVFATDALVELKRSVERTVKVISGAPTLIKQLVTLKDVATSAF